MIKPKYNLMLKRGMCNYFKCHNNGHCTGCSMFTLLDTSSALNGLYVIKGTQLKGVAQHWDVLR